MRQIRIFLWAMLLVGGMNMSGVAQHRWQQRAEYTMHIDFDVEKHQFSGKQTLTYYNNSPDTLYRCFYHLYFNAFQPGSMMDVRSRTIQDPDPRVDDRISKLKPHEIGFHKVRSLKQGGMDCKYTLEGTVLEVDLAKPILPGTKAIFSMEFDSQVPVQIRRSGRHNKEGIDYSMAQWYPKMAEYDHEGWHADPYVGREFHGVWGDFDVYITMPKEYVIASTGVCQNPQEVGHGYNSSSQPAQLPTGDKLKWHFRAEKVHDFAWAADPDYKHDKLAVPGTGTTLHFFYQADTLAENWERLQPYAAKCFQVMNRNFGVYPYSDYSVVQGGDGGMEYPMMTLITGHGSLGGLVSVTVHESIHSWFQGVLASNEAKYPWMDEGFTSYAQALTLDSLYHKGALNPIARAYASYYALVESGFEEPLSTHADHFNFNRTYGICSYSKGSIFLHQLSYILGQKTFKQGMLRYFNEWKFRHPEPRDLKRILEKVSGLELDWYFEYWIYTTKFIDYGIEGVKKDGKSTRLTLEKIGKMPMPLEVVVYHEGKKQTTHYIPLSIMRGEKKPEDVQAAWVVEKDWAWTNPTYELSLPYKMNKIDSIKIDPSYRMADLDWGNNAWRN